MKSCQVAAVIGLLTCILHTSLLSFAERANGDRFRSPECHRSASDALSLPLSLQSLGVIREVSAMKN
ncbi:hypothetical protein SCLCIDRAFT_1220366 [Scleroderma citrinum Foug A]|uniref:Uncharacterized protein n=1 Tax=Scleroderma citrinum Foug A TaxID=1036808 RepID=A0A0C3D6D2_9AGAM|nr:hypothetical protein SCLCIDRAFT_1220366 [Scleroderma citrinum Foug A]